MCQVYLGFCSGFKRINHCYNSPQIFKFCFNNSIRCINATSVLQLFAVMQYRLILSSR